MSSFKSYFADLFKAVSEASATDHHGVSLDLEVGMGRAAALIRSLHGTSSKLILIGNGGSAAIASHQALDFWRGCGIPSITFNDGVHLTCLANDYGVEQLFSKPMEVFSQRGDILLAISSSGRSKNILNAVETARKKGCRVITFSGFEGTNKLRSLGDLNFYVPSSMYGHVEAAHLGLIHALSDFSVEFTRNGRLPSKKFGR